MAQNIFLNQSNFSGGVITTKAQARTDLEFFKNSIKDSDNFIPTKYGGLTSRPGTQYLAAAATGSTNRLSTFKYSDTISYCLEWGDSDLRFFRDKALIGAATISHPYSAADLFDLQFAQSYDVMYIVHKNYAPRKLVRTSNTSWALSTVSFIDGPYLDENSTTTTATPSGVSGSVTVTFSATTGINNNGGFTASDIGRKIRIKSGPDNTDSIYYAPHASRTVFPITFSYGTSSDVEVYTVAETTTNAYTLKSNPADYTINTLGQVVFGSAPGSSTAVVVRRANTGSGRWGWGTITAVGSTTSITVSVTQPWHGTNATLEWKLGAWYTGNYPTSVAFHEQRLYFSGQGYWVWASQIGDYENFQPDDSDRRGNPNDSTALAWQIASLEGNEIKNIVSQQGLAVLSNGDLSALVTNIGGVLTPLNQPTITKNAEISSSSVRPVIKDRSILFATSQKNALSALTFDYNSFGYVPTEVSAFAENLFTESAIKQLAYQVLPNKLIWILREDGRLITYSLQPEYNLNAFTPHTIAGTDAVVQSITSVPSGESNDHLYMIVHRTINGSTARYIEVLENFFDNSALSTDSKFVDSGKYYSGSYSSLTGLSHLEGETVKVVTENGMHPDRTVSGGGITLDSTYTNIVVGLYSDRYIETHPHQVMLQVGDAKASPKSVYSIAVQLYETATLKIGTTSSNVTEVIFTSPTSTATNALQLYTGIKEVRKVTNFNETTSSYIMASDPLPVTVTTILTKLNIVDK